RYAGAAALGAMTTSGQGSGTPGATPDKATRPEPGLLRGEARKRLKGLLSLVPLEHVGGPEPGSWLFTWADVQTQLVALGNPDVLDDPALIRPALSALLMIDPLVTSASQPEAKETFGFSPLEVHQTLVTG